MLIRHIPMVLVLTISATGTPLTAQTLIKNTSTWKYLHPVNGADPARQDRDFHATFATLAFDDSHWSSGEDSPGILGGFGYGNSDFEGVDIGVPSPANRKTAYFRHRFKTTEEHSNLVLKCQRDDGVIIYLDGKEVARDNVLPGQDAYDLFAKQTISGAAETAVVKIPLKDITLASGEHVLAISLHNRAEGSSDLRIAGISLESGDGSGEEEEEEEDPCEDLF